MNLPNPYIAFNRKLCIDGIRMSIQIYQQELQCSVVIRLTYDLGSKNVLVPGQEMQVMIIYTEGK